MSALFEERERAAEFGFAHGEELRFLAKRAAARDLAAWAAENMALDATATVTYADKMVGLLVAGAHEGDLISQVRSDLERAGKPAISNQADIVFARAMADADAKLNGTTPTRTPASGGATQRHQRHQFWGWTV
jgi:hypothetical protein